jgi:hypothetical protein
MAKHHNDEPATKIDMMIKKRCCSRTRNYLRKKIVVTGISGRGYCKLQDGIPKLEKKKEQASSILFFCPRTSSAAFVVPIH